MRFTHGRDRRIRRRAEFLHVQAKGERALTPHFVLLVARPQPATPAAAARAKRSASAEPQPLDPQPKRAARLGVVATKKVGNAAVRNRIKRLCRECFRLWPGFVPDGIDLVVIARDGAHELGLEAVRQEWARARPTLLKRCASVLAARSG